MGLSLIKAASSNVSGNYSPAGLLSGLFDISVNGDTVIVAPTSMGDGQLFCVRVTIQGPSTFTCNVNWASTYVGGTIAPLGLMNGGSSAACVFMHNGSLDYVFGCAILA